MSQKRALVVDDTVLVRTFVSRSVRAAGYEVFEAEDGEEAIQLANLYFPDLIIMDVRMPKKDGIEALHELRQNPVFAETPIIMLTGDGDVATVQKILAEGVTDYILKDSVDNIKERLSHYL